MQILFETWDSKEIKLSNGIIVQYNYSQIMEKVNFTVRIDKIPHIQTVFKDKTGRDAARAIEKVTEEQAMEHLNEVLAWDSNKIYTLQDLILDYNEQV